MSHILGGTPAPNPSYPFPIQCVTGNIEEVVGEINLIDMVGGTNGNYDDKGIKITDNGDGTITINGTVTSNATVAKISKPMNITLLSGQVYTLFIEQVSGSVEGGNFSKLIFQDNAQITGVSGNTSQAYQYTPSQNYTNNINFGIYVSSGRVFNNLKLRVMLVKGNYTFSQLTHEPYITPTSYQLSLGSLEFHGIGTYKDELVTDRSTGKWYKHSAIGKYQFTGNENILYQTSNSRFIVENIVEFIKIVNTRLPVYCNRFQFLESGSSYYGMFLFYGSNAYQVYIYNRDCTTTAELKTFLANNNTCFYYPLNNPTDTEITDTTLINQLEAWYNAHSLNGTTIITSNGDLPLVLKVRGLKGE